MRKPRMGKTGTESRIGEDVSPVARVSAAMAGLIGDYKALQAKLEEKLQKQEERLTMLDHKSALANRPALSTRAEVSVPHRKAFDAYLRSGDDDGLRGLELDGKAMSTAVAGDGGYLEDPHTAESVKSVLASTASIRAIANVVQ